MSYVDSAVSRRHLHKSEMIPDNLEMTTRQWEDIDSVLSQVLHQKNSQQVLSSQMICTSINSRVGRVAVEFSNI